jgi:hypothetical protein
LASDADRLASNADKLAFDADRPGPDADRLVSAVDRLASSADRLASDETRTKKSRLPPCKTQVNRVELNFFHSTVVFSLPVYATKYISKLEKREKKRQDSAFCQRMKQRPLNRRPSTTSPHIFYM